MSGIHKEQGMIELIVSRLISTSNDINLIVGGIIKQLNVRWLKRIIAKIDNLGR